MYTSVQRVRLITFVAAVLVAASGGASIGPAALAAGQAALPRQLLVTLHVTDKKNVPITDLTSAEIEVKENGHARPIQALELDRRPLAVALVLDNNSDLSTSFMQSVIPAAVAAVKALPPDTAIDIWTTGDRPTQVGKSLTDPQEAEAALRQIAAIGVNSLLDTVSEASQALPSDEARRTAMIILTTGSLGDSGGYGYEQALKVTSMKPTFVSLELVLHQADARVENMLEYLATSSAGYFDRVLAVTAFEKRVPALVALVNAQYRVAWQPEGDPREAKYEFKCTRKGAKVTSAQRLSAVW